MPFVIDRADIPPPPPPVPESPSPGRFIGRNIDSPLPRFHPRTGSGSTRCLTPQHSSQISAPTRAGSAPRSNSTSRITRATEESNSARKGGAPRSGAISTRRLRRFENDNLIGAMKMLHMANMVARDNDEAEEEGFTLEVDWRNPIMKLMNNPEAFHAFRHGHLHHQAYPTDTLHSESCHTKPASKTRNGALAGLLKTSKWYSAEEAWASVDRKLRVVVPQVLASDAKASGFHQQIQNFVVALERVLLYFLERRSTPPRLLLEEQAFASALAGDTTVCCVQGGSALQIPLKDSSLHRLMLHATAQFHGLTSASHRGVSKGKATKSNPGHTSTACDKVTIVSCPPKLQKSHGICLVSFLKATGKGRK